MKKFVALFAVLFAVVIPVQAQGADQKALVIIDSYFDSRVIGGNVSCITPQNLPCTDTVKVFSTSLSDNTNHGDAMVEVAKKQNANLQIIALKSGSSASSDVNPSNFIQALTWVDNNSSKVSAVSFSRFFNHATKPCMPTASAPYTPESADLAIKKLIVSLQSKGIKIFTATGNAPKTKVDYPACIIDTMSVTSPGNVADTNTDFNVNATSWNFSSKVFNLIPLTTSSATAAVAAQWATAGAIASKMVSVSY